MLLDFQKHIIKVPKMKIEANTKILDICTLPVLTYGVQTLALTKKQMERLTTTVGRIELSIVGLRC